MNLILVFQLKRISFSCLDNISLFLSLKSIENNGKLANKNK